MKLAKLRSFCAVAAGSLVLVQTPVAADSLVRKMELYTGIQGECNAGVVTTEPNHLNCTTKAIGFTIDDASAAPSDAFVEVLVGNTGGKNAGVVTTSANHNGGATEPIGYLSKNPVSKGTKLYIGTQGGCNAGVVTTSNQHKNCSTKFLGYTMP